MAFIEEHYHKKIWRYQSIKQDWTLHFQNGIKISQANELSHPSISMVCLLRKIQTTESCRTNCSPFSSSGRSRRMPAENCGCWKTLHRAKGSVSRASEPCAFMYHSESALRTHSATIISMRHTKWGTTKLWAYFMGQIVLMLETEYTSLFGQYHICWSLAP